MDQTKIDDFNMALLTMCEQLGVKFLNSAEVLKDETGYGQADFYGAGDIHLKSSGLKAMLNYLRTHAYQTEDRRPDTSGIPIRTLEYTSNPSSAVPDSSSAAASSEAESKEFEARYHVDKNGGGTLSSGDVSGKTSLSYAVTAPTQSVSVTAVPDEGYVFVKWSDGVTDRTRTDTGFKQNLDVTAVFSAVSVQISSDGKGFLGTSYTFKATLKGKYAKAEYLHWYANGEEVVDAAGRTKVTVLVNDEMLNSTYQIYAVLQYNGSSVASNPLVISVGWCRSWLRQQFCFFVGQQLFRRCQFRGLLWKWHRLGFRGRRWYQGSTSRATGLLFRVVRTARPLAILGPGQLGKCVLLVSGEATGSTGATGDTSSGNGGSGNSSAPSGNSEGTGNAPSPENNKEEAPSKQESQEGESAENDAASREPSADAEATGQA